MSRALAACGLMLWSAWSFQPTNGDGLLGQAALLAVLGAAVLWMALWKNGQSGRGDLPGRPCTPSRSCWPVAALGIIGMALLAEANGNRLHIPLLEGMTVHAQFALLCVSLTLLVWGLGGMSIVRTRRAVSLRYRRDLWIVAAVTLAAFAISDTLNAASLQAFKFDVYERAYTTWDLIFSQTLPKGFTLKLAVKNLTDPVRGTVHDRAVTAETVPIREYQAGREYSLSLETTF